MAKITDYTRRKIAECTGEWLKGCVEALLAHEKEGGLSHIKFDTDAENDYCICVGWNDYTGDQKDGDARYKLAWKIGRQSVRNAMQCDLDIDFEMPYDPETGDVDDTLHVLDPLPKTKRDWEREATLARKEARRIWREWAKEEDGDE